LKPELAPVANQMFLRVALPAVPAHPPAIDVCHLDGLAKRRKP
jgi:hypothetical protein